MCVYTMATAIAYHKKSGCITASMTVATLVWVVSGVRLIAQYRMSPSQTEK